MIINIQTLNVKKEILINEKLQYEDEKLKTIGIRKIDNLIFEGKLYYNSLDEIILEGRLFGDIILPDAVDLSDYIHKIDTNIEEILESVQNTLDIYEILWENIVLEVPIRVSNKDLGNKEGDGWKILTEDNEEKEIDPRLQKLQELFKGGE